MMNNESSSSEPAIDPNFDFDGILDSWIGEFMDDQCGLMISSGVETMTINPGPSQPIMSTLNNTTLKGGSANEDTEVFNSNFIMVNEMQNSQFGRTTDFPPVHQPHQNPPLLQQHVFNNNPAHAQHPLTHNTLEYQMPSNLLLHPWPMLDTQMETLQNSQRLASMLQTQQNPNQQQLQLQHGTARTSGNFISHRRQQETNTNMVFSAAASILTPAEISPATAWREYALAQIQLMKVKYFGDLLKMHSKATQFRNQAKNVEASKECTRVIDYLEKLLTFLSITTIDLLPIDNQKTYGYMTQIVSYVKNHENKSGASSQHHEPGRRQYVHPNRGIKLLNNPPPTGVAILDNVANFNQNFPSRRPQIGRMPGVHNNRSSQIGIDQTAENNPQRIGGSFKAPQPIVLSTSQQPNSGSKSNASGFPTDLLSNTTASNFPSRPFNNQPAELNLEKMKQPMYIADESKVGQAMSPLGSKFLNQGRSPLFSHPSTQKPISQQTASPQWSSWLSAVTSSGFDVDHVLPSESIARSPFILSNSPNKSGQSSLSTVESQTLKTPVNPPCKEQGREEEKLKDPIQRLVDVVKSMSSKAMGSSLTDISSLRRDMDIIPNFEPPNYDEENPMLENDNQPERKIRRKLSVSSVSEHQFDFEEWPEIANKGTILGEIKQINSKLLQTSMVVVSESAQGTIVHCIFKNMCFRDLLGPLPGVSSEKMPEFVIQLLVPASYPAFAPKISNLDSNVLSEPWGKLYEKTVTRFNLALRGVVGEMLLGDMAQKWDASVRSVMTGFLHKIGGQSFTSRHGSWESCIQSPSGSN